MRNSKYVHSYFIEKYQSGIFSIVFNMTKKWLNYHRLSDTEFSFFTESDSVDVYEEGCIQEIPEFLPSSKYMKTSVQDKDQVIFYYIPFNMVMRGEILFKS